MYNNYNNNMYNQYPNSNFYSNQEQKIIRVNGEAGARAYRMPPNSSALLLDETQPVIWLSQTDGAGYPTLTGYDISLKESEKVLNLKDLEERIIKIERMLENESDFVDAVREKEQSKHNK